MQHRFHLASARHHPYQGGGEQGRRAPQAEPGLIRPAGRGRRAVVAVLTLAMLNSACYRLVPITDPVAPGADVVLELNDRGRAELADSIGPTVDAIEGSVQSTTSDSYVLNVRSVRYLRTPEQAWSGEKLQVMKAFVNHGSIRELNRKATWLTGIGAAAALTVAILAVQLTGGATPGTTPVDPPPVGQK